MVTVCFIFKAREALGLLFFGFMPLFQRVGAKAPARNSSSQAQSGPLAIDTS